MFYKKLAAIILFRQDNRILLQHRTDDAPVFPGYWSFFGGGVEQGETPEEAVKREVIEELSYQLNSPRLWTVQKYSHDEMNYTRYFFIEKYNGSQLVLGEGQDMRWFLPSEVNELRMTVPTRRAIKALAKVLTAEQ